MALDRLAEQLGVSRERERCGALVGRADGLLLAKPLGYMNRSGPAIERLRRQEALGVEDLLVLVDDLNLPLGRTRLRAGGSSGGHKGLESVAEALGTQRYPRLRMGIGPCPPGVEGRRFVLSPFHPDERDAVDGMTERAARAAMCWAREGVQAAMGRCNAPGPQDASEG
jgi:PTH1 family peptidyl-tRNA hydrolase